MQLNNKFKIVWWAVLLIVLLSLIYKRFDYITTDQIKPFDYIIFTVFIVLAILPFFSEMSMFGFKVKKEIQEVKDSVNTGMQDIRNLLATISNNNTIYLSTQPTLNDKQLEDLQEGLNLKNEKTSIPPEKLEDVYLKDKDHLKSLFAIRYSLENEIRRMVSKYLPNIDMDKTFAPAKLVRTLEENGIIGSAMTKAIKEVYAITSRGIHGGDLDETQIKFALHVGPLLITELKEFK
ncbi:hypothetical protein SB717_21800 [Priestia sp. SIMBA_032]|uniref:hypothetical protein n=1 Tax=Priestia sp. SIMBA_032 TaxID=3085775 RepID=UPI00397E3109